MKQPVKNMLWANNPYGDITQWFGENPALYASMNLNGHNGVDIVRPWGEHLFAVEDGTIVEIKDSPDGYGKHIRLINKDVTRQWTYGHLSHIHVSLNQKVKEGQFIAQMGNTGFVVSDSRGNGFWDTNPYKGTHLHLGLRNIKKDIHGWAYPETSIKHNVLDYMNGYKGSVDPLPLFVSAKTLSVLKAAQKKDDKLLYQLSVILQKIHV